MKIIQIKKTSDLPAVHAYDYGVFSDSLDFEWSVEGLKEARKLGWSIHKCQIEDEIVAVLFTKIENEGLLTKNTPIKLSHQGKAYSDRIKEFYLHMAQENNLAFIYHYCPIDNFRMVALNEKHGYKRTGKSSSGKIPLVEWVKNIKNEGE